MKTSLLLVVLAVLLVSSQAHKKTPQDDEIRPIYKPFQDVPTPDD